MEGEPGPSRGRGPGAAGADEAAVDRSRGRMPGMEKIRNNMQIIALVVLAALLLPVVLLVFV